MKRLLLLRHGKSDWDAAFGSDRERPLAPRGMKAAARVGRFVAGTGEIPDRVLSSPAVRARRTVELANEAGGWDREIEIVESLYGGGADAVLEAVGRQPESASSVLLAGHEPTWSMAGSRWIGGGDLSVPTACLIAIDLGVSRWADADWGRGELRFMVTPRLLKAAGL